MRIRACIIYVTLLFMGACTTSTENYRQVELKPEIINALLVDSYFFSDKTKKNIESIDFFHLPQEIQEYLDTEIKPLPSEEQRYYALRNWVFEKTKYYEYDPFTTVSISELKKVRKINCLSFSILFVAAARYVDISARIQLIDSPPSWTAVNQTPILAQHINVAGEIRRQINHTKYLNHNGLHNTHDPRARVIPNRIEKMQYVVDINPRVTTNKSRTVTLTDNELAARFYTNVGAEALLRENHAKSYLYTKRALKIDPYLSLAWNNLGVLYSKIDHLENARDAYLIAVRIDPDTHSELANLIGFHP